MVGLISEVRIENASDRLSEWSSCSALIALPGICGETRDIRGMRSHRSVTAYTEIWSQV